MLQKCFHQNPNHITGFKNDLSKLRKNYSKNFMFYYIFLEKNKLKNPNLREFRKKTVVSYKTRNLFFTYQKISKIINDNIFIKIRFFSKFWKFTKNNFTKILIILKNITKYQKILKRFLGYPQYIC